MELGQNTIYRQSRKRKDRGKLNQKEKVKVGSIPVPNAVLWWMVVGVQMKV
jgi:hypothetical protein